MDNVVNTVQGFCQHALSTARSVSARAPGTPMAQALVVGVVVWFLMYRLMKKHHRLPPGPWPLPLLGNLLVLMKNQKEHFFVTLDRWAKEKYGPVISIYFGPQLCVMLNDLDTINEALVQKGNDFAGRLHLPSFDMMSEGYKDIAFADFSQTWKLHRKISLSALRHYMTGSHLDKVMHEVMTKVADRMAAEPGPFNPRPYNCILMFHLLDAICFGEAKPYDDLEVHHLAELFEVANKEIGNGFFEDIIPLLKYWPTKKFQRLSAMMLEFFEYIEKNIEKHRQSFTPDKIQDVTDSILLAKKEAEREESAQVMAMFTDVHVRQTIGDLFSAGVDTSRITLDWAMLHMAGHPEIQRKAQAEIDAATGTEMPRVGHRNQLQYTQAVLQETMRISCVAPMALPHKTLWDTSVGGYYVPKDTMVMVNLWAVTHDPRLWDEPDQFKPERFLDDEGKLKTAPKAWMPFSAGRRVCLGESVAKPELLLLLACFLKRFTFNLPEGVTYDPASEVDSMVTYMPKPFQIVVTPR